MSHWLPVGLWISWRQSSIHSFIWSTDIETMSYSWDTRSGAEFGFPLLLDQLCTQRTLNEWILVKPEFTGHWSLSRASDPWIYSQGFSGFLGPKQSMQALFSEAQEISSIDFSHIQGPAPCWLHHPWQMILLTLMCLSDFSFPMDRWVRAKSKTTFHQSL
jgi:hypothetical protein